MGQENQDQNTPPPDGQASDDQQKADKNTPATDKSQSAEGDEEQGSKAEIDEEELQSLRRDAGRWRKSREKQRPSRSSRQPRKSEKTDDSDPEVLEELKLRDNKINELSSVNKKLLVKDQVRDLLDSEDYKEVPESLKKAIRRNPLGFVRDDSETVEHFVEDIKDFLEDELDSLSTGDTIKREGEEREKSDADNIPPASGSGPSSPGKTEGLEDVENKRGSERSTAILRNILKKNKK